MRTIYTAVAVGLSLLASCSGKNNETQTQRRDITEMVFASGILEADDQYNLTAQTDGYLAAWDFKEGDEVAKGQVLAVIDNAQNIINAHSANQLYVIASQNTSPSAPALLEIKANIEAATTKVRLDAQQLERYKRLLANNSVSKLEYDNIEQALANSNASLNALEDQYQVQTTTARQEEIAQRSANKISKVLQEQNLLTAIRPGKVYRKYKQLGDYVQKGDVIAVIGNPNMIYAKLNVDETNMAKLKEKQKVMVKLNTHTNKIYKATVRQILPAFDEVSRSFIIKAYFEQKLDFDITGTQLQANIIIGTKRNALVIPSIYLGYGNKVTMKDEEQIKTVKPGIISNDWVEILSGLQEGQTVITKQP